MLKSLRMLRLLLVRVEDETQVDEVRRHWMELDVQW
jgi:hypothetical protein